MIRLFSLCWLQDLIICSRENFSASRIHQHKNSKKSVGECVRMKAKKDVKDIFMTEEREREIKKVFFANIKSSFRFACFGCLVSSTY
jgi:hypothetical protein